MSMPSYHFLQVDVFTDEPFGGNPLAVFPDAQGLSSADMQRLALELNLSETTFVLPAEQAGADFKVRIFTPREELPFAGHPLVGTHWALAHLGRVDLVEPATEVVFELGVGLRPATLLVEGGRVRRVVTAHQRPEFGAIASMEQVKLLAQALNLPVEAIAGSGLPVQVVSTGLPQLFVPVRSLAEVSAIEAAAVDGRRLGQVCREMGLSSVMAAVFTMETELPGRDVHLRFFAPSVGVPEDPATGSASGGLGSYLVRNRLVAVTGPTTMIVTEQGLEMGRPSKVFVEVDGSPEAIGMVRVSGDVVPVMAGDFRW